MFNFEDAVAAVSVRHRRLIAWTRWPVDDLLDEVRKLKVHLFAVGQGQRVAFAAQLNSEVRVGFAALDFQAEG